MYPFEYSVSQHARRHGPAGYKAYQKYRDWLRDEFDFRCAYCLVREQWVLVTGYYHLDHFVPQAADPRRVTDYDNLIYACSRCNSLKGSHRLVSIDGLGARVEVRCDGSIRGLDPEGRVLIDTLRLDSVELVGYRSKWIRIAEAARRNDLELYRELLGYPQSLPDLRRLRPPRNTRPKGLQACCFARRECGELPDVY